MSPNRCQGRFDQTDVYSTQALVLGLSTPEPPTLSAPHAWRARVVCIPCESARDRPTEPSALVAAPETGTTADPTRGRPMSDNDPTDDAPLPVTPPPLSFA